MLNLVSTTTVFGTAIDVTLQELALETFFPADAQTQACLRAWRRSPLPEGSPPAYDYP